MTEGMTTMSWWRSEAKGKEVSPVSRAERRREPQIGAQLKIRYSGSEANHIVMGYGVSTDLSRYGFGIQGSRGLKPGTELVLFVELPDSDSPVCIPQAIVSWVEGRRFGVELRTARGKGIRSGWNVSVERTDYQR